MTAAAWVALHLRNSPLRTHAALAFEAQADAVNRLEGETLSDVAESIDFCKNRRGYHSPLKAHAFAFSLQQIHKNLFSGVYDWAGEFRTIPISREDKRPCFNACPETLEAEVGAAVRNAIHVPDFLANIGKHYTELNYRHPFREGNGRTQKVFFFVNRR